MSVRVAINGFGRIGRNAFKIAFDRNDVEIVAINDIVDVHTLAYLLKYDSSYGIYAHEVNVDEAGIAVNGVHVDVLSEADPTKLPWSERDVDVVVEATGQFADSRQAQAHIEAGAKKVVLATSVDSNDIDTIILGVNEEKITSSTPVVSNASCTTNCVTPVLSLLDSVYGVEKAMMTTVHSYTADQSLQDGSSAKNLRETRAAAENIVPTTTAASSATVKAFPALNQKFSGLSVHVPTPVVSMADIVVVLKKHVTTDEINQMFKDAASQPFYQGILDVTDELLVSSDFKGNSHSCVIDLSLTTVVAGDFVKIVAWYDNEWGYSNRLVELVADVGRAVQNN